MIATLIYIGLSCLAIYLFYPIFKISKDKEIDADILNPKTFISKKANGNFINKIIK